MQNTCIVVLLMQMYIRYILYDKPVHTAQFYTEHKEKCQENCCEKYRHIHSSMPLDICDKLGLRQKLNYKFFTI